MVLMSLLVNKLTRCSSHASFKTRTSCTDFMCSAFTHGPHRELEGASRDVLASVLDVYSVGSDFLRDEAHTICAAPAIYDVGVHRFPTGAGHLCCHGLRTTLSWGVEET